MKSPHPSGGPRLSRHLENLGLAALYLLAIAAAGITLWAAGRGFDLLDGGYYYLVYSDPSDVVDIQTSFQYVGRLVFIALGRNIVLFRLASFLLVAASAGFLGISVARHHRRLCAAADRTEAKEAPLLWALAALTFFAVSPAALTYNSLNAAAIFAVTGLVLPGFDNLRSALPKTRAVGWLELGAAVSLGCLDLFIKPPTALLLSGAVIGLGALTPLLPSRTKLRGGAALGVGILAGYLVAVALLGGWTAANERILNVVGDLHNSDYASAVLQRLGRDSLDLLRLMWLDLRWTAAAVAMAAGTLGAFSRRRPAVRWAGPAMGAILLASWMATLWRIPAWEAAWKYYALGAATRANLDTVALLASCALPARLAGLRPNLFLDRAAATHAALAGFALLLLPFAGAFGTTNLLYLNAAYQVPCWTCVAWGLLALVRKQWKLTLPMTLAVLPLAVVPAVQYFDGAVIFPYGLKTGLGRQQVSTPVGVPSTRLLLDPENSRFINATREILESNGFKPGDDIFAFFNLPGLVYAVGGRSPVIPWYFGRIYAGNDVESSYMRAAGKERRRRAFLITQDDLTRFRDHFRRGGIPFPDGYELIGRLTNPNTALPVKIWKPRNRPD